MIKNRVKDKINSMLEEVYEIVFYDCNSNRDIRIGALKSDDYKKYLPVETVNKTV
ncbi:hypothetical protein F953_00481 [Acinetobacter junii CIP 107470 = MTCC 11364]|nr:hypothetical protein F953_00481 [Acinetobacter junii CIP 107470 = MTCC 11364]